MGHDQSKSNDDEVQKPAGISGGSETEAERRKSLDHVVESRREDEDEDGGTQTEDDEGDHFNLLILSPMLTQVRVDEQQDEVEPDKGEGKKKTTKEMGSSHWSLTVIDGFRYPLLTYQRSCHSLLWSHHHRRRRRNMVGKE